MTDIKRMTIEDAADILGVPEAYVIGLVRGGGLTGSLYEGDLHVYEGEVQNHKEDSPFLTLDIETLEQRGELERNEDLRAIDRRHEEVLETEAEGIDGLMDASYALTKIANKIRHRSGFLKLAEENRKDPLPSTAEAAEKDLKHQLEKQNDDAMDAAAIALKLYRMVQKQ